MALVNETFGKGRRGAHAAAKTEDRAYEERHAAWTADCDRKREECGLAAAEEAHEEAMDACIEIRDRIAETRARTLDGLSFKARYAATHCEGAPDDRVVDSILDDLLAMTEEGA